MGLLDQFSNLTPDQSQGLLAAAAQMLQASGPSLRPTSFGQILGSGVGAFQQAQQGAQDRQQQQAFNALKMQGMQSELDQKQALLDMQKRIRQRSLEDVQSPRALTQQPQAGVSDAALSALQPMGSAMPGGPMSPKTGGPDWLQAYQSAQPSSAASPASPPPSPAAPAPASMLGAGNLTQAVAARLTRQAQIHAEEGDMDGANKLYEQATKFMPEVNKIEVGMSNGQPVNVITFKDGTQKVSQFAPKPDIHFADDGQHTAIPMNGYTGQSMGPGLVRQATPGEVLQNRQSGARLAFDKSQAEGNQDAAMDPLAVRMTAQQYLAGDSSALQNFGRGAQGAANLNAVRLEVAKQANAAGMSGADIAAKMAEFGGLKAGQRTAGTRSANIEIAANEVAQLAPIALDASSKVARSGLLPFGKAQIMFNSNTNDQNMRQFAMANTALVNAYGQAMARGGAATVSDKDHARELLSTAFDQPSYAAAVEQLQKETRAAQAAPKQVRKDLSDSVSGREVSAPAPAPRAATATPYKSAMKGQVMDGYRFKGGNPADPNAWEKL